MRRRTDMTRRLARLMSVAMGFAIAGAACSSTSPSESGSFTWSVDGRAYQAAQLGLTYANASQNTFSGFTCTSGQNISISTPSPNIKFQTGTYHSPGSTSAGDAFQLVIKEGLPVASGAVPSWVASAGTLTLTTVNGSHIVGSFDVTLSPDANSTETGTAHGTGTFDVPPFTAAANLCGQVNGR